MAARILVVEDNPASMELMGYLLQAAGHELLFAHDGREAIEIAERERPAAIVCDINLPRLDGYGILHHIKEHSDLKHTPCIAVTALAMVGDREKLLDAGFDGYISKPLDPETFVDNIEGFLHRGSSGTGPADAHASQ
ncbi:MAG TPA: response regulator [Noviherbaspirillum sp.]